MSRPESWTFRKIVAWMQADFERRGNVNARLDADLLVAHALGVKRIALFLDPDRPLNDSELTAIRALVERRRAHEPIAYILGEREFYGRAFQVTRDVLIPRPDTETLVEQALAFLKADAPEGSVLDLCTGSGCVAITLAAECPERTLIASDLSVSALAIAGDNARRHQLESRISLRRGDLFAVLAESERCAVITANPPYIGAHELPTLAPDVRDFEPRMALDAGTDALSFYRRLTSEAARFLLPSGALLVEVGYEQASDVEQLFRATGFSDVRSTRDLNGIERVVSGRYPG